MTVSDRSQLRRDREGEQKMLERLGDNRAFLDLLRRAPIQTIHSQEATLEDIFIRITGRSLT
jgi:fluoroquinolone transport system ATP-binding protein